MKGRDQLPENTLEQAALFSVLADPTRLKLVKRLQRHRDALCVNALADILGVSQSAVSQHLRVLRSIGLVKGERRGYHVHCFINHDALEKYHKLASTALGVKETETTSNWVRDSVRKGGNKMCYQFECRCEQPSHYTPWRGRHRHWDWCCCCCPCGYVPRRFRTKDEIVEQLEEYLKELRAEVKGIEERIAELKREE